MRRLPWIVALVDHGVHAMPGRVLAGEQAGPRRSAVGGARIGLPKHDPLPREAVEPGRFRKSISGKPGVAPAEIVGEDEDHVGSAAGCF